MPRTRARPPRAHAPRGRVPSSPPPARAAPPSGAPPSSAARLLASSACVRAASARVSACWIAFAAASSSRRACRSSVRAAASRWRRAASSRFSASARRLASSALRASPQRRRCGRALRPPSTPRACRPRSATPSVPASPARSWLGAGCLRVPADGGRSAQSSRRSRRSPRVRGPGGRRGAARRSPRRGRLRGASPRPSPRARGSPARPPRRRGCAASAASAATWSRSFAAALWNALRSPPGQQLLLRRAQLLAGREQALDLLRPPPRQLVQRPRRERRLAERLDRVGLVAMPLLAQRLRALVARAREISGRQRIELVRRLLHRLAPRRHPQSVPRRRISFLSHGRSRRSEWAAWRWPSRAQNTRRRVRSNEERATPRVSAGLVALDFAGYDRPL